MRIIAFVNKEMYLTGFDFTFDEDKIDILNHTCSTILNKVIMSKIIMVNMTMKPVVNIRILTK